MTTLPMWYLVSVVTSFAALEIDFLLQVDDFFSGFTGTGFCLLVSLVPVFNVSCALLVVWDTLYTIFTRG